MRAALPAGVFSAVVFVAGCGGGSSTPTVALPSYDAEALARAAVAHLDKNGNGTAEGDELDASPGLKAALGEIDADGDKKLTADELRARFARYTDGAAGGGPVGVGCSVYLDGKAAANVAVRFEPEPFLAAVLKPATGTTDAGGYTNLKVEGEAAFGVYPGVYRIAVTRAGGPELPARYNTKTTLGREVFEGARSSSSGVELRLKSG